VLVEDGTTDINRATWEAFFLSINRLIDRVHDEIVRQRDTGVIDTYRLLQLLTQLGIISREKIEGLITHIDKVWSYLHTGINMKSDVRRDVLSTSHELRRRLDNRSLARKLWEAGSRSVKTINDHFNNVWSIFEETSVVLKQLVTVRRHLMDFAANASDIHSSVFQLDISAT